MDAYEVFLDTMQTDEALAAIAQYGRVPVALAIAGGLHKAAKDTLTKINVP